MSTEPYHRKQGEFELRVLKDGRLVFVAPDEALLEVAEAFGRTAAAPEVHDQENQHAAIARPERRPTGDGR